MYYLETNSLRQLHAKLADSSFCKRCYTSSLSLFELLSGISDKEYVLRKAVITNVLQSSILIDWDFPLDLLYKAFEFVTWESGYPNAIKKACETVAASSDLSEVTSGLVSGKETLSLSDFGAMDDYLSSKQIELFRIGREAFEKMIDADTAKKIYDLLNNSLYPEFPFPQEVIELFRREKIKFTMFQLAVEIAKELNLGDITTTAFSVFATYNQSLNYYFDVISYFFENRVVYNRQPGRNDVFDIAHFMYLKNSRSTKIVSDDKLVKEICLKLWPRKYVSVDSIRS